MKVLNLNRAKLPRQDKAVIKMLENILVMYPKRYVLEGFIKNAIKEIEDPWVTRYERKLRKNKDLNL